LQKLVDEVISVRVETFVQSQDPHPSRAVRTPLDVYGSPVTNFPLFFISGMNFLMT
jgi:hypothetical protein